LGFAEKTREISLFTVTITLIAVLATVIGHYILQPPELFARVATGGSALAVIIAGPISYYMGVKFKQMSELYDEREKLINYDRLTGVLTREGFFERMARNGMNEGLTLMIDLDHFKAVNDTYGHFVGDEVLRHVAARIRETVRPMDLLARFGGEEFILFLKDMDKQNGLEVAERIRSQVAGTPVRTGGAAITVTVSIGAAKLCPQRDLDLALRSADSALYAAKTSGRNRLAYQDNGLKQAA
jgi:diguanylate cyclase (GGDEF)-like protein